MYVGMDAITYQSPMNRSRSTCCTTGTGGRGTLLQPATAIAAIAAIAARNCLWGME